MTDITYEPGLLLDLDGTLVDSVYDHIIAWDEAFHEAGYNTPLWRVHAAIGMGSRQLVTWVLGGHVPEIDEIADAHRERFLERADELRATRGAVELLDDLERRKVAFRIATSAESEVGDALVEALGRRGLPTVDASSVQSPKPAPDLLLAACQQLGVDPLQATLVGDSPWDAEAASKIGMRTVAVRTGGFGDDRLLAGGAVSVVDDPRELLGRL